MSQSKLLFFSDDGNVYYHRGKRRLVLDEATFFQQAFEQSLTHFARAEYIYKMTSLWQPFKETK